MAPVLFAAIPIRCLSCPPRLLSQCHYSPRRLHFLAGGAAAAAVSRTRGCNAAVKLSTASWELPTSSQDQESLIRLRRRADGLANVLAIGTANPPNCVLQDEYPDWFFRVTQTDHLTHLKAKMKNICGKTEIKKRYFHHNEDLIRSNPDFLDSTLPSLNARQGITVTAVPELAAAAAAKAIAEWGRPPSDITHLIFCTYSCTHMPGADLRLASLLGLSPSVQRTMLYFTGCNSGAAALRLAKDVAENNRGARVLVACAEISLIFFRAPEEVRADTLVFPALFGDGAGAVVVGSDPAGTSTDTEAERPLFELMSSAQATIPGSDHVASTTLAECGFVYDLPRDLPSFVADNIEHCLVDVIWPPLGLTRGDWNDLFWVVHPGGRAVLDGIQGSLKLDESKLNASRRVLSEYGNMGGATIIFVLDEMRRRQQRKGGDQQQQDGGESEMMVEKEEECECGAMVGFGPGLTVETMLLRATGN